MIQEFMALEGGLIVGYLTAAVIGAGKRWVDRKLDALLEQLTSRVAKSIGRDEVDQLASNPKDESIQRELSLAIDTAMHRDQALARELSRLVAKLDKRGGRKLINQVYAQNNLQAFDQGVVIGGDVNYFHGVDHNDLSGAPTWVKLFMVLGTLLFMAGMAVLLYAFFTDPFNTSGAGINFSAEAVLAFGICFTGVFFLTVAGVGRALSRRR